MSPPSDPDSSTTSRRNVLGSITIAGGLTSLAGCVDSELEALSPGSDNNDEADATPESSLERSFEDQTTTLCDSLAWVTNNYGTALSTYRDQISELTTQIEAVTRQEAIDDDDVDALVANLDNVISPLDDGFSQLYPSVASIVDRLNTYQTEITDRFPDDTWPHTEFLGEMQSDLQQIKTPQYVESHFPRDPLQGVVLETLGGGTVPEATLFELYHTAQDGYPVDHFTTQTIAGASEIADAVYNDPFEAPNVPAYQLNPRAFAPLLVPTDRRDRLHITVSAYTDPSERQFSIDLESVPLVIQRYADSTAAINAFETLTEAFDTTEHSLPLRTAEEVTIRYTHPDEEDRYSDPTHYHTAISSTDEYLFAVGFQSGQFSSDPSWLTPLEETWFVE